MTSTDQHSTEQQTGGTQAVTVYRGAVEGHLYVVRARHGVMDTWATLIIDGVFHDPRREKEPRTGTVSVGTGAREATGGEVSGEADGLAFGVEDSFGKITYAVKRPDEDGQLRIAERIRISTAGLGGKGEVEVLGSAERVGGFFPTPLAPDEGTASWGREQRKLAHPVRFALVRAMLTAAKFLIPLLGLGALFSGLLDPVTQWVADRVRPVVDAIVRFLQPVGEMIDAVLEPIRRFAAWLSELLFGWIPELSFDLPVPEVPAWVVEVAFPVGLVLVVFLMTLRGLRRRRDQLEQARSSAIPGERADDDEPPEQG